MDTVKKKRKKHAFTLIELLMVVAIMSIMMVMAMLAFFDLGISTGMRGSVLNMTSALNLARQKAITMRKRTMFTFGNTNTDNMGYCGFYMITNAVDGILGNTNFLSKGIEFSNDPPEIITFKLDGSCPGATPINIILWETTRKGSGLVERIKVLPLTGQSRVIE